MPLRALYVDLNSFFASVEQQDDAALRGRPVAVVAVDSPNTACLAASYEAKALGVKTGTLVRDALVKCPQLVLRYSRTARYVEVHHAVIAAVDRVLPVQWGGKVWSIDEVCCMLHGPDQVREHAVRLAKEVKASIRTHVGECMTSSIGIAPNRWLAKIASDMQKPDGLVVIEEHELPQRLFELKLTDLPGVGPKMLKRLQGARVGTMEDLCALNESQMRAAWGSVVGAERYHWLRGAAIEDEETVKKSIGHEHVLGPKRRTQEGARAVLVRLVNKAAARARACGVIAGELTIGVRMMDGSRGVNGVERGTPRPAMGTTGGSMRWGKGEGWHTSVKLEPPTSDTLGLTAALAAMWDSRPAYVREGSVLKVSATLSGLEHAGSATLSLFAKPQAGGRLSEALDKVNARFGKNALYVASMHEAKDTAPPRIAFSNIPGLEE